MVFLGYAGCVIGTAAIMAALSRVGTGRVQWGESILMGLAWPYAWVCFVIATISFIRDRAWRA